MTSDKFMCLFGNWAPLCLSFWLWCFVWFPCFFPSDPAADWREKVCGKGDWEGIPGQGGRRHDGSVGHDILGFGGQRVITAASMRSRGYGSARRSCFQVFRVTAGDRLLLVMMLLYWQRCLAPPPWAVWQRTLFPSCPLRRYPAATPGAFLHIAAIFLIPTVLHFREALQWHILRSRI